VPETVVTAMFRNRADGIVFATLGQGAMVYRDGKLETLMTLEQMPGSIVISMAEGSDGSLWLGTRDTGLYRFRENTLTAIAGVPDQKINCLLPAGRGALWIGTDNGVVRWNDGRVTTGEVPASLAQVRALVMHEDRDGNVWVGTASHGLLRANAHGVASADPDDPRSRDTVTAIFEDRDRNIWIGSTRGLERLRDGVFSTYAGPHGLPANQRGPIYVDHGGRTWFGPAGGGLYWLRGREVVKVPDAGLSKDVVYSIAGNAKEIWVGRQRGGLTRLRLQANAVESDHYTQAAGLAQNNVYSLWIARDGSVWAGTLSAGVSHFRNGSFTTYTVDQGLASNTISAILEASDGRVWLGTPNGLSVRIREGARDGWRQLTSAHGLPSNEVNAIFEDSLKRLWVGTASGLALIAGAGINTTLPVPTPLRASILGIAEDRIGWLWIATSDGLVRVHRERLANGGLVDGDLRQYGLADGLLGIAGVKRHRSVVSDPRGRIWFSTSAGLSVVDPVRAAALTPPPLSQIEAVYADERAIELQEPLRMPSGPHRITVAYAGLSLAVPERVSFRYRLDGFDSYWSAPKNDRQAEYTNLGPGDYRFRVQASNGDGLWNGAEATLAFQIAPAFWQTRWFQSSMVLGVALLAWAAYRVRMRQLARRLNVRFEERLAERTRIAQELHDTLLQGFVSASMQLHVAADRLPPDSPAKPALARVMDLMGRVIEEGRNAVRGLRGTSAELQDLAQAFSGVQQEFAPEQTDYRVIVEGRPRPLNPVIRDEVYRIGREALVNAFRHSGAKSIELQLEYAAGHLRMLVRDDGRGIDPERVQAGSDNHWGLSGMRERAERIGARFKVWSRASAGTEVELSIPGRVAFRQEAAGHAGTEPGDMS
jgi:signal transduction histidine kinase/sugar lactone lactonase YvrE